MKVSEFFLPALKETPADAQLVSHQLMLRAGMIRKLASGVYAWLPMGQRVLHKVMGVIREEMAVAGSLEVTLPSVQPAELWQQSGRWDAYGKELLKFTDRHDRAFCYGPTHEEVIASLMSNDLRSYKQLPLSVFQIQTKFRDEIRPRFGVMRSREFIMKDAYSFHIDGDCLGQTYEGMYAAYTRIFDRIGLRYRAVLADTGSIGGEYSHEFQVLADSGEDVVVYSDGSDYAANLERASALAPAAERAEPSESLSRFATPGARRIRDLDEQFSIAATAGVKTLIVVGASTPLVALVLRGDQELNEIKAEKHPMVQAPLTLVSEDEVESALGAKVGSLGPVGLSIPMVVDRDAAVMADFVCGANETGFHYRGVNWARDCGEIVEADLRHVVQGDASPDGQGTLHFARGIEVGHIFQLGDKYAKAMSLTVLSESGKAVAPSMGCYGIGVTRIVAAAIEQCHDDRGIVWPAAIAPFQVALVPLQMQKSFRVREATEQLYASLVAAGVEVLWDDRKERPGVMFSTMDLIGIPHRIIVGERGLDKGTVEYKARCGDDTEWWPLAEVVSRLQAQGLTTDKEPA